MRELLELLKHDARRPAGELASMLNISEYEVEQKMAQMEKDKIILSYKNVSHYCSLFSCDNVNRQTNLSRVNALLSV